MKRIALLLLGILLPCAAQNVVPGNPSQQLNVVSGTPYFFTNSEGAGTLTFAYSFTGTPSGVSITVQGCAQDGTNCTTLTPITGASPYVTAASGQQQFIFGYAQAKVTATFSGTTLNIYKVGVTAKVGGSGSGGGATFPSTAGVVCNTSTTASQNCGSSDIVTALNNSPSSTLSPSLIPSNGSITYPVFGLWGYGDSYRKGQGAKKQGHADFHLLANDTPTIIAPVNNGILGANIPQINQTLFQTFIPQSVYPQKILLNGGNNDATQDTCGSAANSTCITQYKEALRAAIGFGAVPPQYRQMASTCTPSGFTANSSLVLNAMSGMAAAGTGMTSSTNGATLTCTIPATNNGYVGLNTAKTSGLTGTYTVSIDGNTVTDDCSGTTTFSSGYCTPASNPVGGYSGARQMWPVTAGVSHTLVITNTAAQPVYVTFIDTMPATAPANTNVVEVQNSSPAATLDTTGVYSAAAAAVVSEFQGYGFSKVILANIRSAMMALPGNGTQLTDALPNYIGSTSANHPGDTTYQAMYRADLAAEAAAGFSTSSPGMGGQLGINEGNIYGPLNVYPTFTAGITPCSAVICQFSNFNVALTSGYGWSVFNDGNNVSGARWQTGMTIPGLGTTGQQGMQFITWASAKWICDALQTTPTTPAFCKDLTTGSSYQNGPSTVPYVMSANSNTIASASTITPANQMVIVSGTATIDTITPLTGMSSTLGGCIDIRATGNWQTSTAGNIDDVVSATAGTIYRACYFNSTGTPKWTIK